MAVLSKTLFIAFGFGIASHHGYFIRGEHLTNIPPLLLFAAALYLLGTVCLVMLSGSSLTTAGLAVAQTYSAYLTGLYASILMYRAFFHQLRNVPGPLGARLSKFYHLWSIRGLDQYRWFDDLHKQYGPVVRVGTSQTLGAWSRRRCEG